MPRRVLRFVLRARDHETFWCETWSGAGALSWGLWSLATPGDLSGNPAYGVLTADVPEQFWECLAVALGAWQIAALVRGGRGLRWLAGVALGAWWGLPVMSILSSPDAPPPGIAAFAAVALVGANCTTVLCLLPGHSCPSAHFGAARDGARDILRRVLRRGP